MELLTNCLHGWADKEQTCHRKTWFQGQSIKHPRYKYVVYRIEDGRRVEQTYFQSERAANSHAYAQNIRLKNEGMEGQIIGPEPPANTLWPTVGFTGIMISA